MKICIFIFILIVTAFSGCTTTHFKNSGTLPILTGVGPSFEGRSEVEIQKDFFLWGFLPETHTIWVDHVVAKMGFESGANIEIEEQSSWKNTIFSILSLGMFLPKSYKISVQGLKAKNEK